MNNLIIYIDSSTLPSSNTSKYGRSSGAWSAWWSKAEGRPLRAGTIYLSHEGPNKIFYDCLIRALESCLFLLHKNDSIEVFGDCDQVIKQLNGERRVLEMLPFYKQIKYGIEKKYKERCGKMPKYFYIGEKDLIYRKVDKYSKETRILVDKIFK